MTIPFYFFELVIEGILPFVGRMTDLILPPKIISSYFVRGRG